MKVTGENGNSHPRPRPHTEGNDDLLMHLGGEGGRDGGRERERERPRERTELAPVKLIPLVLDRQALKSACVCLHVGVCVGFVCFIYLFATLTCAISMISLSVAMCVCGYVCVCLRVCVSPCVCVSVCVCLLLTSQEEIYCPLNQ